MKSRLSLLLLFLITVLHSNSEISWIARDYDFGLILESEGESTGELPFVNIGSKSTYLNEVKPGCGCTSVDYTKGYIYPGDTSKLVFKYNPEGRPGKFKKNIKIYEGKDRRPYTVTFSGTVMADSITLAKRYPYELESLRLENLIYPLGKIRKGNRRVGFINIYNSGLEHLKPLISNISGNIQVNVSDEEILPGEESSITFSLNPDSTYFPGLHTFEFEIGIEEGKTRKIEVTATVTD